MGDEASAVFEWRCRLDRRAPVRPMAAAGRAHGVTADVVGFQLEESGDADLLDLDSTAAELGWESISCIHLRSVPVDKRHCDCKTEKATRVRSTMQVAPIKYKKTHLKERSRSRQPLQQLQRRHDTGGLKKVLQPCRGRLSTANKVAFVQENPKRDGTLAYERPTKYCTAKTGDQGLRLGACIGDIKNDFDKGYLPAR